VSKTGGVKWSTRAGVSGVPSEKEDPLLVLFEPRFAKGVVDPVIHPVAGDDQVGLDSLEHAVEALVQIGPGELAAGVTRLGEPRYRLAGQAQVQELAPPSWIPEPKEGLKEIDVRASVGDAVAKEDRAADADEGRPWAAISQLLPSLR
jgi:hypothetical protein